jgi:AGCS family alanine or glycine:cation symporter
MKFITTILLLITSISVQAQDKSLLQSMNETINDWMWWTQDVAEFVFMAVPIGDGIPFVLIWLVVGAIFFTVKMNFINISGFKYAIDIVKGKFDEHLKGDQTEQDAAGQVSHFQALATALSGTVGLGNIAGVAVAVAAGGPGATFWMIIAGLFGMASKFVECTLGVKYREVLPDGTVSGGPMYYLNRGLAKRNFPIFGKFLGGFFAICCIGGSLEVVICFKLTKQESSLLIYQYLQIHF